MQILSLLSTLSIAALAASQSSIPAITTYAPVPPTGNGPAIPASAGYRVEAFGHGAYMITDGTYQAMFLIACKSVIVVDAPPTIGHNMLKGIRTVTDLPISHMIYSHSHADHIGAAYLLINRNTSVIAHQETAQQLANTPERTRPAPTITFQTNHTLQVCNQTLHLSYPGPNHEPGNIFIFSPYHRILMVVDIIYPGWVPYDYLGESQNIPGYLTAHTQILAYDFRTLISGHINRVGTRADVLVQKEYMTDLLTNCRQAIELSASPPNATNLLSVQTSLTNTSIANPGNPWASTYYYIDDLLGDWCANKTNEKWLGRLAGADVYGKTNAHTMLNALRIDFGVLGPTGVQQQK